MGQQSNFAPIGDENVSELRDSFNPQVTRVVGDTFRQEDEGNFITAKPLSSINSESKILKSKHIFEEEKEKEKMTPSASANRKIDLSSGIK